MKTVLYLSQDNSLLVYNYELGLEGRYDTPQLLMNENVLFVIINNLQSAKWVAAGFPFIVNSYDNLEVIADNRAGNSWIAEASNILLKEINRILPQYGRR